MVDVTDIGCKVHGFKLGCSDGLLSAIKVHSTPSFGGEVKPEEVVRFHGM
jgi:hypothetical protein